jgi:hypothetical protein
MHATVGHARTPAAIVGLLILVTLFLAPANATADQFWDQDCDVSDQTPCTADNWEHTYCWDLTFYQNNLRDAANYAMENLGSQTFFFRNKMPNCTQNTDIVFAEGQTPGQRGKYLCIRTGNGNCEQAYVFLNPQELSDGVNRRKTACHEVGHSAGLSHSDDVNGCMQSGYVSSGHQQYWYPHHVDHLNDNF